MPKKLISRAELLEKVRGTLTFHPQECRNIHIDGIQVYEEQLDGANWHIGHFRRSGDDNHLRDCQRAIAEDIRTLRKHYDVAPD